jgi:hypothetical protein
MRIGRKDYQAFFRELAKTRWARASREERSAAARHASQIKWRRFAEWKESHATEAAAAAALGKALRRLGRKRTSDEDLAERLERRLARAVESGSKLLPWAKGPAPADGPPRVRRTLEGQLADGRADRAASESPR